MTTIINKPTIIPADRWDAIFKTGKPDPTPEPEVHYDKVNCPYCGRLVDEDAIERPVDYCHHD